MQQRREWNKEGKNIYMEMYFFYLIFFTWLVDYQNNWSLNDCWGRFVALFFKKFLTVIVECVVPSINIFILRQVKLSSKCNSIFSSINKQTDKRTTLLFLLEVLPGNNSISIFFSPPTFCPYVQNTNNFAICVKQRLKYFKALLLMLIQSKYQCLLQHFTWLWIKIFPKCGHCFLLFF